MAPAVLLDLVRSFVAFETEDGRRIKKVARYQQVIAVDLAIRRILAAPDPALRGGVIHHTQGSGKSTMVMEVFWPLMTQCSPSSRAVVFSEARSEPALGSEKPWHQNSSPARIFGR